MNRRLGDYNMVELLIERGLDLNHLSMKDGLQLDRSIDISVFQLLLGNGAEPGGLGVAAACCGYVDAIRLIFGNDGEDHDRSALEAKPTPVSCKHELNESLIGAAFGGYPGVVKRLLDYGADPKYARSLSSFQAQDHGKNGKRDRSQSYEDDDGRFVTALLVAVTEGHLEVVKLLIKGGADPGLGYCSYTAPTIHFTPLLAAVRYSRLKVAQFLFGLQEGQNTRIEMRELNYALLVAAQDSNSEMFQYFLNRGAMPDPVLQVDALPTPLIVAAKRGNVDTIHLLLRGRANPDFRSRYKDLSRLLCARER